MRGRAQCREARTAAWMFWGVSCFRVIICSWANPTVLYSLSLRKVVAYIKSTMSFGDNWLTDHKLESGDASSDDRRSKVVIQAFDLLLSV